MGGLKQANSKIKVSKLYTPISAVGIGGKMFRGPNVLTATRTSQESFENQTNPVTLASSPVWNSRKLSHESELCWAY